MTDLSKDGLGILSCITKCLEDAGVSPEEVNYVNCHATSTLAGDLAEVNAIKKIFKYMSENEDEWYKGMYPRTTMILGVSPFFVYGATRKFEANTTMCEFIY
ncbi:hypothetical protein L2E82_47900 [Cichorium intybus]|uniref:Uncharacterized protein n=1 Tax=Cichorium intybus TaxID=13427 RepID=A0ACB8YX19_CICIN|nr:hypothetical protein L2E82_47900 [Cichorium intybus]